MPAHQTRTASFVLVLALVLLPLASSIGNAESPEYTAVELPNGTIVVLEPNSTYTDVSQGASLDNGTTTTGQEQPFVYNEAVLGLNTSTTNQSDSFDFIGNGTSTTQNVTEPSDNSFVQEGYLEQEDPTVDTAAPDSWNYEQQGYPVRHEDGVDDGSSGNNATTTVDGSDFVYAQQGYLVQEDPTVDMEPSDGDYGFEQAGYLEQQDSTVDAGPTNVQGRAEDDGPGSSIANALQAYLGNLTQDGSKRRYLRGS